MSESKSTVFFSVPYEVLLEDVAAKVMEAIERSRVPEDPEELIKVSDISKDCGTGMKTLLQRVKEKHLPTGKIGKSLAIPRKYKNELLRRA